MNNIYRKVKGRDCLFLAIVLLIVISCGQTFSFASDSFECMQVQSNQNRCEIVYDNYITGEHTIVTSANRDAIVEKIESDRTTKLDSNKNNPTFPREGFSMMNFARADELASQPTRTASTLSGVNNLSKAPYSGTCQLYIVYRNPSNLNEILEVHTASGSFISENSILTAAHCLVDSTLGVPNEIRVYYCYELSNSAGSKWGNLGYCSAISTVRCSTYSTNDDTMYDYGIINIASYAGQNTGVYKLATITPTTSTSVTAIGYPTSTSSYYGFGSYILSNPNSIKVLSGNLDKIASDYLRAKHSVLPGEAGMSGGPLLAVDSNNYYQLLGIISRENTILFTKYQYFCRVATAVKSFCATYGGTNSVPTSLYLKAGV